MVKGRVMNRTDLAQKLETIDIELARQGIVLTARPYEAHRRILTEEGVESAPLYSKPNSTPTLFEQIERWYEARYGDRMKVDAKVGEMPFMLRGLVYFFRFPVVMGKVNIDIFECVEGLTDHMFRSLVQPEIDYITNVFAGKYHDFLSLDRFNKKPPVALSPEAVAMVNRGLSDINAAISILKTNNDVQGAMFHAQQAAEKFIKAELMQRGLTERELRRLSHNIQDALNVLISRDAIFSEISSAVNAVNLPSMDIRYTDTGHTLREAVQAVDAAVHICSFINDQWWLNEKRGGHPPSLVPGKFYGQAIGTYYKCVEVKTDIIKGGETATLMKLDLKGFSALFTQSTKYAFYYYEITDPGEIDRLEKEYQALESSGGGNERGKAAVNT